MGYFLSMDQRQVKSLNKGLIKIVVAGVILAAASLSATLAVAEKGHYKWIDSSGRPAHSDRPPPPGVEYEFVSSETGLSRRVTKEEPRTSGATAAPAPQPSAATGGQTAAGGEQLAIEKNPALCDSARANLDTLNSKARVRIRDGDGSIRYLTPDEKDVQRQKAQDLIAVHCN